jgi:hypothetical protein
MLNNILFYYVLTILTLFSLNLFIKFCRYLYYYLRMRFFYYGSINKFNNPLFNSYNLEFIFKPRAYLTIFGNYYNMLIIVINYIYWNKIYPNNLVYIKFLLFDSKTGTYYPLSKIYLINTNNKINYKQVFYHIKWLDKAYDLNSI